MVCHDPVMQETELKFQVPAGARAAVGKAVAGRTPARRVRLQAAYVDTPARLLAEAGLALRVRREGRLWVQTLKGAGADGMTRFEHNVPLGTGPDAPVADPQRHAGTAVGERLLALLAGHPAEALSVRFSTDLMRRTRLVRSPHGVVELAFDQGFVAAGDGHGHATRMPLCELEIELKRGSPQAVIDVARRWLPRHGLWLDSRSKAERGDMLARGAEVAAARTAQAVTLTKSQPLVDARRQVLRSCTDQVIVNASQVAAGGHGDEHVHQLRVGLRRLRTALQLFAACDADEPAAARTVAIDAAAAALFRSLGELRDAAVTDSAFGADLDAALHSAGVADVAPVAPGRGRGDHVITESALARSVATQTLLLDLLAVASSAPIDSADEGSAAPKTRATLARQIARWHRKAAADAKAWATLDDAGRHRLRKRIKRLRYAVEFSATLFHDGSVRRYLRPLRKLQDKLGEINDVVVAMAAYRSQSGADLRAMFALGWLASRRDVLLAQAEPQTKGFARVKGFWKAR
jgi:triphosphatase